MPTPRLAPEWPLPPYTFVPGQAPHPMSHADGHRFAVDLVVSPPLAADFGIAYRLGLDLFNLGYYWEAHETWEKLWHTAGRKGADADFFKALIHLAAAGVKAREGVSRGIADHARRAEQLFQSLIDQGTQRVGGLDLAECIAHSRDAALVAPIQAPPEEAFPVFRFSLCPRPSDDHFS